MVDDGVCGMLPTSRRCEPEAGPQSSLCGPGACVSCQAGLFCGVQTAVMEATKLLANA